MKPIRKISKEVSKYPTFTTRESLEDLLYVHWTAMNVIGDEDEVLIDFGLPAIIPVTIQVKKGKKVRTQYRVLNGKT